MQRKNAGSITFGTGVINTEEYLIMAKVMKENGSSVEQIALEIEAMDEMMQMYKVRLIPSMRTAKGTLRKSALFQTFLDDRVNKLMLDLGDINK